MKGASVSDLHLGFRAFAAMAEGRNARERDVEIAWEQHAVPRIIAARPGLVTIAGDVFHNVRPSFHAVRSLQNGIRRILRETDAHIVIILGNHEAPKTAETLSPVVVVDGDSSRVHVVTTPKRIRLELQGEIVSIACLPFVALATAETYAIEPDPDADVNVLVIHAAVRTSADVQSLPAFYAGDTSIDIGREAEKWNVIAVGDFHEFRRLHPTALAFYSGSIERTSSNMWPEKDGKGVVVWDTDARTMELQQIPTRPVLDLTVQDLNGYEIVPQTAAAVNSAMVMLADVLKEYEHGPEPIVRLKVEDFDRNERGDIDQVAIGALRTRCFHFQLDLRFAPAGADAERVSAGPRTLDDEAAEFFAADAEPVRDLILTYIGGEA